MENKSIDLYCSFCGMGRHEVKKIIRGPKVYICNGCTELCYEMVREGQADEELASDFLEGNLQTLTKDELRPFLYRLNDKDQLEIRVVDKRQ